MSQMAKRERFPLLRTSSLKLPISPCFREGVSELLARISNLFKFWNKQKAEELLNMILKIVYQRGIFGKIKWNMKFPFCRGILDISGQELFKIEIHLPKHYVPFCLSFRRR